MTEFVTEKPNGDLQITDSAGRTATLHWSRFHGLAVSSDAAAVYLGQPETIAWLSSRVFARGVPRVVVRPADQSNGVGWEEVRIVEHWPTPNHMRRAAEALDQLSTAKYGDILRYVADLCDAPYETGRAS